MAFGLGRLRLSPDAFWSMTPRELAAAMQPWRPRAARAVGRDALAQLMNEFPDKEFGDG